MDYKTLFDRRKSQILTEMREAENKYKVARKEARDRHVALERLRASLREVMTLEHDLDRILREDGAGSEQIDASTSRRVSEMIVPVLLKHGSGGLLVAQIGELLDVKRSTISATLYNMKQRGEVVHNESTGKWALPAAHHEHMFPHATVHRPVPK